MTTFIITSILIFIATAFLGAREGYRDAKDGTDPDHSKDFVWRVCVGFLISAIFNDIGNEILFKNNLNDWIDYIVYMVFQPTFMLVSLGFLYGALLNIAYNLKKGKKITYIGTTAETDKFSRKEGIDKYTLIIFFSASALFGLFYYAWILSRPI